MGLNKHLCFFLLTLLTFLPQIYVLKELVLGNSTDLLSIFQPNMSLDFIEILLDRFL